MRKFAKISAVLAAMVLALAFVGCNSDDDDDDPSVVTTWYRADNNEKTLLFYDDGTFASYSGEKLKGKGTYTGDTTKDGDIEMTATEWDGSPVSGDGAKMTITIKNSSFEFLGDTYTKNKNGTGTTSTANVVTTWQRTNKNEKTLLFYNDGTFASYDEEELEGKGTYTGDTTKDGDIEMTTTEWNGSPVSGDNAKMTITIENSSFEFMGNTYTKK